MLDKVGEAGAMLWLGARPDHRVEADRRGLRAGQRVDRDGEAIAEAMQLGTHWAARPSFSRFLTASP